MLFLPKYFPVYNNLRQSYSADRWLDNVIYFQQVFLSRGRF